jgi:hypothetical protein
MSTTRVALAGLGAIRGLLAQALRRNAGIDVRLRGGVRPRQRARSVC